MKIGIIGGGVAGLASAWLLQEQHAVTLFEGADRLGGHADTVEVEQDGKIARIDAGFEFFFDSMFPRFIRLLSLVGAPIHRYPVSATLYSTDGRMTRLLPPYNRERVVWSAYHPSALWDLLLFQRVIARSIPLIDAADPFITLEDYLRTLRLPERFTREFLYPFLLAEWCVELDEFRTFSAYNALKYVVKSRPGGFPPISYANEVVGGTGAYVAALAQTLTRTQIHLSANITHVTHSDGQYTLHQAGGAQHTFDHLIIATGTSDARRLLGDVKVAQTRREELDRIDTFTTIIAVHEDRRLMPANPVHWSVVNTRYDAAHSQNTVWKRWKSRKPIFRSWVTYDTALPEPLHHARTYQHPKVNGNYFRAQRNLIPLQGKDNLWLAGLYMYDIDCHESALLSAVGIAQKLAPQSGNLQRLMM